VNALLRFGHEQSGTTMVEFSLVAPVLFLILVCCLDFARGLNAYVVVTNASRDGARFATMNPDENQVRDYVARRMSPLFVDTTDMRCPPVRPTDPCIDVIYAAPTDLSWSSDAPRPSAVTVEIRYPWQAVTWLVGSFISATGSRTFDVISTMEAMR
jgi:Flp pilus assembly protein TadG